MQDDHTFYYALIYKAPNCPCASAHTHHGQGDSTLAHANDAACDALICFWQPTMDRVAEPLPALASTTTVPAFWIFSVRTFFSASVKETGGVVCRVGDGEVHVSRGLRAEALESRATFEEIH